MLALYKFVVMLILAFYVYPFGNYILFDIPIPDSTAAWGVFLTCCFLTERLYIAFNIEKTYNA